MKQDWKKTEKSLYSPGLSPELVTIPAFGYFTLRGQGNPNSDAFAEDVALLYALSYGIKMLPKKGPAPEGYHDYTIYPLEGIWDLLARARGAERFDKDDLVYHLMIRQPDFVTDELAAVVLEQVYKKKKAPRLADAAFERIADGTCVQMLHIGPYDNEPASFMKMQEYCESRGLVRTQKVHREIYLSDARKTPPDKLKTVLRFYVSQQ